MEDSSAVLAWDQLAAREKEALVRDAVNSLPENQRMAVLLRRYEGFSYEEIAGTLQCSVSAVKSLLNRAKESLKQRLQCVIKDYE
jgi:RNA polymerase sigma-70 factor (ECF subfamily)